MGGWMGGWETYLLTEVEVAHTHDVVVDEELEEERDVGFVCLESGWVGGWVVGGWLNDELFSCG